MKLSIGLIAVLSCIVECHGALVTTRQSKLRVVTRSTKNTTNSTGRMKKQLTSEQVEKRRAFAKEWQKHRAAVSNMSNTTAGSTGLCGVPDGHPSTWGVQTEYCPFCRWCCRCNDNDPMDCEFSTVSVDEYGGKYTGVVVFCDTCENSCSHCSAFNSPKLFPNGDCCDEDLKHQPPFNATYR